MTRRGRYVLKYLPRGELLEELARLHRAGILAEAHDWWGEEIGAVLRDLDTGRLTYWGVIG